MACCYAGVMELADMQDLGSCEATRAGSSPVTRIQKEGYAGGMSLFLYKFEDRT